MPKDDNHMRYPSDEPKQLAWGRHPQENDLKSSKDIYARGWRLLHVAFSDSDFGTTPVKDAPLCHACISTMERLPLDLRAEGRANNLTIEDSFSEGQYEVQVEITTEEGSYVRSRFKIYVGTNWRDLRMQRISRFENLLKVGRKVRCFKD